MLGYVWMGVIVVVYLMTCALRPHAIYGPGDPLSWPKIAKAAKVLLVLSLLSLSLSTQHIQHIQHNYNVL
jgi:hypothetical protein